MSGRRMPSRSSDGTAPRRRVACRAARLVSIAALAAATLPACGGSHGGSGERDAATGGGGAGLDSGVSTGAGGGGSTGSDAAGGAQPTGDGGPTGDGAASSIARVAIVPARDLALAPGSAATLTAQAFDGAGAIVPAEITWRSSSPANANVSAGVVTAVALGQAQVTATAGGVASPPVTVWVNAARTGSEALADAVAAGELTAEDALVYEVFAAFGDVDRIPGKYLGTVAGTPPTDDLLMIEAANQFDAMTAEHQAQIGSYFVPPAYEPIAPTRRAGGGDADGGASDSDRPGYCSGLLKNEWTSVESTHFHVWYNKNTSEGPLLAPPVSLYAEHAYDVIVKGQLLRPPLDDSIGQWQCYGGDGKLDIYLLDRDFNNPATLGKTVPTVATGARGGWPVYLLIAQQTVATGVFDGTLEATIAHEFMHAVQFAYFNLGLPSYRWVLEATATWAEDLVIPGGQTEQAYAPRFVAHVDQPLFFPNHYCDKGDLSRECRADSAADHKMYGAYLFFQYLAKNDATKSAINLFFQNADTIEESLVALSVALSAQGGLNKVWPDFVATLWNEDPIPEASSFRGWDDLGETPDTTLEGVQIEAAGPAQKLASPAIRQNGVRNEVSVNELGAVYEHYVFPASSNVHSAIFYNGYSQKLSAVDGFHFKDGTNDLNTGPMFIAYDTTEEEIAGRNVRAFKKIGGVWTSEDWTLQPFVTFCLDKQDERVEELAVIYSNSNFTHARSYSFDSGAAGPLGDQRPTLVFSPVPCWKYQGHADANLAYDDMKADSFDLTTRLRATFVGQPHVFNVTGDKGHGYLLSGWVFAADPATVAITETISASLRTCGPSYTLSDSLTGGAELASSTLYFDSLIPIPDNKTSFFPYAGRVAGTQWIGEMCGTSERKLPTPSLYDFLLDYVRFQEVDLPARRIATPDAGGLPGPVYDDGDYATPGSAVYSWCLAALREGDPAPTVCP